MSCGCCRKPRYKRLVDSLFPDDPQSPAPVAVNMDKLLFFAQDSPDHLDQIGEYIAYKLRRSLHREKNGHVCVALKVIESLLSAVDTRRLQLLANSYLDILHLMLETPNTGFQIMATNSFVKFAEREEGNTPYHRQYDFLIHRFASLSLVKDDQNQAKYHETRMAGLKGLRGVIMKISRQDSLQINIWDLEHMNKIVPPFLFNMHSDKTGAASIGLSGVQPVPGDTDDQVNLISQSLEHSDEDGSHTLGGYSQESLMELVTYAGLNHIDSVLKPILQHFDLNNLWTEDKEFTAEVYVTVVEAMQRQDRYKAVQSLVDHLDSKIKDSWETKQGILDTLCKCVAVAADGSLGPSVLDIFRTLVRHLRTSIETGSIFLEMEASSSIKFRQSITKTVGEFASVLPDYHKPDILGLINSYIPLPTDADSDVRTDSSGVQSHPLQAHNPMLTATLVKCLRAVAETYNPSVLETAFPGHLFTSLVKLLLIKESSTQLDVLLLWHKLVDHHDNKSKIPLTTDWESLENAGLSLGVVSARFLSKTTNSLFTNLLELVKVLSTDLPNITAFYQLMFLFTLEFSQQGTKDMLTFLHQLQELAIKDKQLKVRRKVVAHATVAGVLYLTAIIAKRDALKTHVDGILSTRREKVPSLLPDAVFRSTEELDGAQSVSSDPEMLAKLLDDEAMIFRLSEVETNRQSPAPSATSHGTILGRDSTSEISNHFSVSLDYGSPLHQDQMSFDRLKEKVEVALSSEAGPSGQGDASNELEFQVGESSKSAEVSFDAMVGQSARGDNSASLSELVGILNTSAVPSAPVSVPSAQDSAYDMELPSLH